jgi:glycosyltransferase involved in cell wall biosynthesis
MVEVIFKSHNVRRNVADKLVSAFHTARDFVLDPPHLRMLRIKYDKSYAMEGGDPLISVYIPTYNRAAILKERALPSVLAQTYVNFELIIVGDHCTDHTKQIVAAAGDKRIRFYNIPVRQYRYPPTAENHWLAGPVVAANTALAMAKGRWIARIDDDDIWTVDHLEKLLHLAKTGNYEFVSSCYEEIRKGKQRIDRGVAALDPYYMRREIRGYEKSPLIGGTQTWLYRSYLKFMKYNINCWRKSWNRVNDVDLSQRFFRAGVRMGFLDEVTARVTPRPGEDTVGLEAYKEQEEKKKEHYKFE